MELVDYAKHMGIKLKPVSIKFHQIEETDRLAVHIVYGQTIAKGQMYFKEFLDTGLRNVFVINLVDWLISPTELMNKSDIIRRREQGHFQHLGATEQLLRLALLRA